MANQETFAELSNIVVAPGNVFRDISTPAELLYINTKFLTRIVVSYELAGR